MNLAGWRFVLFALVGTAAIVLLASIGVPEPDAPGPPTGTVVGSVAEALHEARLTGNARRALEKLRLRLEEFPGSRTLRKLEAVLVAELESEVGPVHPAADAVEAERQLAVRARARGGELRARMRARESLPAAALVALLSDLEADEAIANATEALFAPLGRWRRDAPTSATRPDELAARVQAYLAEADALGPEDEELLFSLIRAFRSQDRPRARLRWSLRAFGLFPGSQEILDELTSTYLGQERIEEAFLAVGTALRERPDDAALWELRAKLAGYNGLLDAELVARRRLLAFAETPELHRRIVDLCRALGRPGDAVENAEALVRGSTDRQELLRPVLLALDAGQTDRAFAMLEERAAASDDPAWWHERIVDYAAQDMREDRVLRELRWLHERYPDRGYDRRLEGILRRRHRLDDLAALLAERLERTPDDRALEQEVISLRAALGDQEGARELLARQATRPGDPLGFFRRLPLYRQAGIDGLGAAAVRAAEDPALDEAAAPEVLLVLEPLLGDAAFRRAALTVAGRFRDLPDARAFRVRLADRASDDAGRAAAMENLAREHFGDADIVAAWADRAAWAGDLSSETKARERLVELRGGDVGNRKKLADLYGAQNRPVDAVEQWRYVAAREGLESPSQLRLVDALLAAGEIDEAMAVLEKRARLPNASLDDQLHVAGQLFDKGHFDRAARFYDAVLERDGSHAEALLQVGRIRAWTNDPRGAIPFLEKRLAVSNEDAALVQFTLGECLWAIGEDRRAQAAQEVALRALEPLEERTADQDVMVAKMLARFGRYDEAKPLFERVLAAQPDNVDLVLDYADAMLATQDYGKARELVDVARAKRPQYVRAYRLDGMLALREKRYRAAAAVLEETLAKFGPDAGTASELARARRLAGDFAGARDAYAQAHALQPDNRDLEDDLAEMEDWLSPAVHVGVLSRRAGNDSAAEAWVAGSTLWKRGRTRLGASLSLARFEGPADVVNGGLTDVSTDLVRVDLAATNRFRNRHRVGGGVELFPGAGGNTPVSLWGGLHLTDVEPYWSVRAKGWWNGLLDNPAAAAGLGGRTTGVAIDADRELGGRFWIAAGVRYERLSLAFDGTSPSDPRFTATATFGWRAIDGALRVADAHRVESALMPGVIGARLPAVRPGARRNSLSVWVNASTYRLLGDAELSTIIPLGERFDYVILATRYDRHLADRLGFMAEAYIGREFQEANTVFGGAAGLGWRPKPSLELAVTGAYGSALGRAGDEDSISVRLGLTWRW